MKFIDVANVFDKIEKESSRLKITKLLANLLKIATPNEAATISYLSLGQLNPIYVGTQFNFAEKSLKKVLAHLFNLSYTTVTRKTKKVGDLGLVVEKVGFRSKKSGVFSIKDVSKELHEFERISGIGAQEAKERKLLSILKQLDPISAKYVVRIIIGKLRLGFSDMTLLDAFSWMEVGDKSIRQELEDAYNVSADIGLIIKVLKEDGIKGIKKIEVVPGVPIRPAAAERLKDAKAIIKKIGACVAQPKLDGFRLQVHIEKKAKSKEVHFFSRNLQDMSHMFPDLKKIVQQLKVKSLVAEGEAIAYDPATQSFLPFQETVRRKRKYKIEKMMQEFPLRLFLFDILFLNGKSLINNSHKARRKILLDLFKKNKIKKQDDLQVIDEESIKAADELEKYFSQSIASGLEGLVVKRIDAVYTPGKRNFNWIKLKRQESGRLDDTLDCVILGYYSGRGKRAGFGIGALLVGVYNKKKDCFQTIAKIGTGLSDKEWKEQKKQCDKISVKNKPKDVECAKELFPDVWVQPKIVCMIRADEITKSPLHTAGKDKDDLGLALRFPRLMGYRPDKSASDATTVKEVKELHDLQYKKGKKKKTSKKKKREKVRSIFDV